MRVVDLDILLIIVFTACDHNARRDGWNSAISQEHEAISDTLECSELEASRQVISSSKRRVVVDVEVAEEPLVAELDSW